MLKLNPYITQNFAGEIWRLEIDELTGTLLLELRNQANRQVSFASVCLKTGHVNFSNYTTTESWLTGMETAFDGVLLLHHYQAAGTPVHKGIIAVDTQTGKTLWSNYTMAFDHITIKGPVVYNTQVMPRKLYLADIHTGNTVRLFNPVTDTAPVRQIKLPAIVDTGDGILPPLPAEPYGRIVHYIEHNNRRIISLHTGNGKSLKQHLYIMDDADIVYEDLLNTDIQKLQPEAFVLHKNSLICLVNKTGLMVFEL